MAVNSFRAQLRITRSDLMADEIEDVALRLFAERAFGEVTVEDIAAETGISARTFYRYFPTKEDIFQRQIDRRTDALRVALARQPAEVPPLRSLRLALVEVVSAEDDALLRRWMGIVAVTPTALPAVIGGIQLKSNPVIAAHLADRLGLDGDSMVAVTLAAATGGVIQAAHTQWFLHGGQLATRISDGLEALGRALELVQSDL